jgi:CBS domain-containing protein
MLERLADSPYQTLAVTDEDGRLLGVVGREEIELAGDTPRLCQLLASQLMRRVTPLSTDDCLDLALEIFVENNAVELPVVDCSAGQRVVGILPLCEIKGD